VSGYTPSEEEVRGYITEHKFREFGERFDRFLAEDRRKTAAKAWDETIQAFVWALENGTTDAAIEYVLANNPYAKGASEGDEFALVQRCARAAWLADNPGRRSAESDWDNLTMIPPVYEAYRAVARAVLAEVSRG